LAGESQLNAQHRIATYFEEGKAVLQDMAHAAVCYGHSAAQVNIRAARNLKNLYLEGKGITRNFAHVAGLFRRASNEE